MNTRQIIHAIAHLKANSIGVYAADHVPRHLSLPAAVVSNIDTSDKPGSHWIAMYIDKNGYGIYFDSYGVPPLSKHHLDRLRRNCVRYRWNRKQLQSFDSRVCGEYCIMFLYAICNGLSLQKFNRLFSLDTKKNDDLASKFYKKIAKKLKYKRSSRVNSIPQDANVRGGSCNQICTSMRNYVS